MSNEEKQPASVRVWLRSNWRWLLIAAAGLILFLSLVYLRYWGDLTLPEPFRSHPDFKDKTGWDVLEVVLIPLAVVVVGFVLALFQRKTERDKVEKVRKTDLEIAEGRQNEQALQNYLDRMTDLLLKEGLRTSTEGTEVRTVSRIRTLTILRSLDGNRKGNVMQFLYEAELIGTSEQQPIIDLSGADLTGGNLFRAVLTGANLGEVRLDGANLNDANLSGANLSAARLEEARLAVSDLRGADLTEAILSRALLVNAKLDKADLREAHLDGARLRAASLLQADLRGVRLPKADISSANLSGAKLSKANFRCANLESATLTGADLSDTDLREVYLRWADLSEANLTNSKVTSEQLAQAKSLKGATLPDGTMHEGEKFDQDVRL